MKRVLRTAGSFLAILGVLFVAWRFRDDFQNIDVTQFDLLDWSVIVLCIGMTVLANVALARAWCDILAGLGEPVEPTAGIMIYGRSQIAKYVPGNVAHLIGRQLIGVAAGLRNVTLVKSTVLELSILAFAAVAYTILLFHLVVPVESWARFMGFGVVVFVSHRAIRRYLAPAIAKAYARHVICLAINGGVFLIILWLLDPAVTGQTGYEVIVAGYVVAWLAGLLTPGAPAGIGVREAVLLVVFDTTVQPGTLILAVLLSRIVSTFGDCIFYAISILLNHKRQLV